MDKAINAQGANYKLVLPYFLSIQMRIDCFLFITFNFLKYFRIDTGDDNRVSKEEFCSDKIKDSLEKWVGPIEDLEAEFEKIDTNGGGQVST